MKVDKIDQNREGLRALCNQVRDLIHTRQYDSCYTLIVEAMKSAPHAPEPHNLLGMLLEEQGNHLLAMKHFRAAWDLDPTYLPSRHNLEVYGTFFRKRAGAYDESDCPVLEEKQAYTVKYGKNNVGHMVRRNSDENK
jgi:Tfp pilus assembly protein PilF